MVGCSAWAELAKSVNLALYASNKNVESHFAENTIRCVSHMTFWRLHASFLTNKIVITYPHNLNSKVVM